MNKREVGSAAERLAVRYLKRRGYKILDTNKNFKFGEADIIATDRGVLVFVEVKFRESHAFGRPEEAVGYHKQRTYLKMAEVYVSESQFEGSEIRFDVIAITGKEINHIKDAFTANTRF